MNRLVPALLLVALAVGAHEARVHLIRSWFRPGPRRVTLRPSLSVAAARARGPLRPVRVLLVDGLSAHLAAQLPAHRRLCAEGLRLRVDVGFPAVSLPVQNVLWTGAWQAESGVAFAIERLPSPLLLPSLPALIAARSSNAVAIAESHREIVSSFPFTRIVAPPERGAPLAPLALQQAVLDEAQTAAPLVFVHVLAVDEASHRHGGLSPEAAQAARASDDLLAALMAARRPDWTLLALADHGHVAAGGHGDAEPEVRWPQACLAGPGIPPGRTLAVGMPDVTAILAERLGLAAPPACSGRGLTALLQGATPASPPPPRSRAARLLLALVALGLVPVLFFALRPRARAVRRPRWLSALLPWSTAAATLLLLCLGPPSLSRSFVYPSLSPLLAAVGLAAGLVLALQLATAARLGVPSSTALALLAAGSLAPAMAAVVLGGWPLLAPPLVPYWSGWASSLLEVGAVALVILAVTAPLTGLAGRKGRA